MEHGPNPLVKVYGDALWGAFMDVTTVGSNIMSVEGRERFGYGRIQRLQRVEYKTLDVSVAGSVK